MQMLKLPFLNGMTW